MRNSQADSKISSDMKETAFREAVDSHAEVLAQIRESAHTLHASVNQTYDKVHPYGLHLDMVADSVRKYGHAVCETEDDIVLLYFGAYYHDSIEDARLTYNDVKRRAMQWMNDAQSRMAAEIVYALTNDKGRTREERAGEKYYKGIRETPYAPFIKLCDRFANMSYSFTEGDSSNARMREVYRREWLHFKSCLVVRAADNRLSLPEDLLGRIECLMQE